MWSAAETSVVLTPHPRILLLNGCRGFFQRQ